MSQSTDCPSLNDLIFQQLGNIGDIAMSLSPKDLHKAIDDFKRITDQLVSHAQGVAQRKIDTSVASRRNCITAISIMEYYVKEANAPNKSCTTD